MISSDKHLLTDFADFTSTETLSEGDQAFENSDQGVPEVNEADATAENILPTRMFRSFMAAELGTDSYLNRDPIYDFPD
jgi:hypothetical protein